MHRCHFRGCRHVVGAGRPHAPRRPGGAKASTDDALQLDDALDKLNETIRLILDELGPQAPSRYDAAGIQFYIAYSSALPAKSPI